MNIKCEWASHKYFNASANLEVFGMWIKQKSEILTGVLKVAPFQKDVKCKGSFNFHHANDERKCVVCSGSCSRVEDCDTFTQKNYFERWKCVKTCPCVESASITI